MTVAQPIRYPDAGSQPFMTRRAWWLVVLNVLIPGSAQVLAGNKRLGRFGLGMTLLLWMLALLALIVYFVWPTVIFTIATNAIGLTAAQIILVAYAVLWVVLTLDTLRLVRIIKATPRARPLIALFSVVLLVGVAGTATYGAYVAGTARGAFGDIFQAGPSVPPINGRYNIMLLGGDAGPDREGLRPDSMSVVSIDADTGQAVVIGLPRDLNPVPFDETSPLRAEYPDGYGYEDYCNVDVCQLNSIYTEVEVHSQELYPDAVAKGSEPGIEAMRDALEGATGLQIQYYVLLDMEGFAQLIDALGGVDIEVTERIPITASEDLSDVEHWIEPGKQHMDGTTAQLYARIRHGVEGGDYGRMARQKQLMEAILRQFNPVNVVTKFEEIAKAGDQVVKTDIPQDMLGYFINLGMKTRKLPVTKLDLVPPTIDPEDPDYGQIHELVQQAVTPTTPEPSAG